MNAQQFKELHLIYDAVYDENLREEVEDYNNTVYTEDIVEVATEYFYSYGLNSDGIDILVEKVGLESFVEFVYDLSEDLHVLTEARAAKKRTGGESYADVKAKIDAKEAAKKKAKEAGAKKKSETSGPESEAKKEQPKSKAPVRDAIARGIFRAVDAYKAGVERHREATKKAGDAYRAGVEKHSAATATASKLAKETGKTVGKAAQVAGHLAKSVGSGVGIAAKAGKKLVPEEVDIYDVILSHLLDEGYAESVEQAEVIMVNMSEEWREEIVEGYQEPKFGKKDYIKKLSKRGGMGMGTPEDPHGYRDPGMAKVGAEFSKRKTAAMKAKKSGEPDTYRSEKESQSKNR